MIIFCWLQDGMTPIMHAIKKGDAGMVDRLLDAGADVEMRSNVSECHIDYRPHLFSIHSWDYVSCIASILTC